MGAMMRTRTMVSTAAALLMLGAAGARLDAQATVCKDGSTSAVTGRGACSGHGGVDAKATAAAKDAAKAQTKAAAKAAKSAAKTETKAKADAGAEVECSDGTMSKGGRGACSGHGGVKRSAAATAAPSLPAAVPPSSPARTRSEAKSQAPSAREAAKPSSKRGEDNDATGAIAQCKDGLYSHAANRQGACSRHGGVAKWLKP
jgi:hypothetical protein